MTKTIVFRRCLIAGATAVLGGSLATPLLAQPALEEILVTARRTTENLRDIPLQVTALSAETITNTNMLLPRDLNALSPGLNWQIQSGGRIGPGRLYFRGLASGNRGESKGAVFLDGDYLGSSGWDIPFHYFQRVEVMPGPQSAQFGRATFGGGINYVTKDPTDEAEGIVNGNVMTLGQQEVDVYYGGPLVADKLLGSLFASYQNYDAPKAWRNPPDVLHPKGVQHMSLNSKFGAGKLVFQPTDDLRIEGHVMYTTDDDGPTIAPWPLYSEENGIFTKPNGQVVRYPAGPAFHIENVPGGFPYMVSNWDQIQNPNRRQMSWRTGLDISWDVADHNVSLLGYREYEWSKAGGTDGDFQAFPASHTQDPKQTLIGKSLELRVTSPQDQRFRYAVGLFYLDQSTRSRNLSITDFACLTICEPTSPAALFNPQAQFNAATSTMAGFGGTVTKSTTAPVVTDALNSVRDESAFAALFFDLTDKWTLSFEGRYQSELIKTQSFVVGGFTAQHTFKSFVPRVTVDYKYNDQDHVYALFSIGNNPGGFNTSPFVGLPGSGTTTEDRFFDEEKLNNYELGAKQLWFGGRVSTDLAVYHMDWKGQLQTINYLQPGSTTSTYAIVAGAGSSQVDGMGLSVNMAVAEGLTINGNLSYNYARYKNFCSTSLFALLGVASPGKIGCVTVNGNYTETVPAWINSLNVNYTHPLAGDWNWVFKMSFQYQDGQWESDMNLAKSEAQYQWHLNLGVERENFNFELYCTNCSQEETPYRFIRLADARHGPNVNINASVTTTPRRPRQWGFKTYYKF